MLNKIYQTISVALLPFKDLTFFNKDLIYELLCNSKIKELHNNLCCEIMIKSNLRNLDELNLLLDKYYLSKLDNKCTNEEKQVALYKLYLNNLESFTKCMISHRDGEIVYKYWKNSNDDDFLGPYGELEKVEIFHSLGKIISMDLLVAMYLVSNNVEDEYQLNGFYDSINLADMQLDDVLIKGVSENHLHNNAAFNFNLSWQILMNENISEKLKNSNIFASNDFLKYSNKYVLCAKILRILLTKYLKEIKNNSNEECYTLEKWMNSQMEQGEKPYLFEFLNVIQHGKKLENYDENKLMEMLEFLKTSINFNEEKRNGDIVLYIFEEFRNIKTYGENIFLFESLKYLNTCSNKNFIFFSSLFFQYIRIKNEIYHQVVQGNSLKGLDHFQDYFKRATSITKSLNKNQKEYYKLMLRTLFQNQYLKNVELRFGMSDKKDSLQKGLKIFFQAYREVIDEDYLDKNKEKENDKDTYKDREFPKIGIIYHFNKKEDAMPNEKCWCMYEADNESSYGNIAFKKLQFKYKKQLDTLKTLRNSIPYLSYFILGIDAASLENATPVQVFAPLYESARDSSTDPLIMIDKNAHTVKNKSLAFTFHAGEDFRHLISGLRRIDEVINYCKFHSGDRIGHATALGINCDYWSEKNPVIILPRGEYLDNLLWIWGIYTKTTNNNPKIVMYLEQQIYKIGKEIWSIMNGITTPMLYNCYEERFKEFKLKNFELHEFNLRKVNMKDFDSENFNLNASELRALLLNEFDYKRICENTAMFCVKSKERYNNIWTIDKILHSYNCKCYATKINEPIYVAVDEIDKEIINEVQKYLIENIAKRGIIVEVNPSSNEAIGEIKRMFEHHAFIINTIDNDTNSNVMININSDDPMLFNTNISNEFAYLYYGLLYKGVSKEVALKWIEKVRVCGMETSFKSNRLSNRQYYEYLNNVIQALDGDL